MAVKKELTYQDLVNKAVSNMVSPAAATTPAAVPAGVDASAVYESPKMPEGSDPRRDSKQRLDAFTEAVPNRKYVAFLCLVLTDLSLTLLPIHDSLAG